MLPIEVVVLSIICLVVSAVLVDMIGVSVVVMPLVFPSILVVRTNGNVPSKLNNACLMFVECVLAAPLLIVLLRLQLVLTSLVSVSKFLLFGMNSVNGLKWPIYRIIGLMIVSKPL